MAGISHASAGSPVQDPNTCTFWDSVLDIFYEADCGSQYVGLTIREAGDKQIVPYSIVSEEDYNNDGIPDVKTTFQDIGNNVVEINVTQTNYDGKGGNAYKWSSAICPLSSAGTITKEEYNPATQVWSNTGALNYGTLWGMNETWCAENNRVGYSLYGAGSGNKTFRLHLPSDMKDFKFLTGKGTEEVVYVLQNQSTIQYLDVASGLEVNNTLKKWNGLEYVLAPDQVWINQNTGSLKFGANDTYATNDTQYVYELTSNKNIWHLESTKWVVDMKGENYQLVDFADVCKYQGCSYEYFNNQTGLKVYFVGEFINTTEFTGIIIDPAYTVVPTSSNLYNDTTFESATNIHLEINDTAERYASFDGSGDYISTNSISSTSGNYTFSFWLNPRSVQATATDSYIYDSETTRLIVAYRANDASTMGFFDSSWKRFGGFGSGTSVPADEWSHVTMVFDASSSNASLYINGVYNTSLAYSSENLSGASAIGSRYNGASGFYNGSLDEMMIFERVLNSSEIANIYSLNRTQEYNGSTDDLVAYYPFDDIATQYDDYSGNGNDGTAYGDTRTVQDTSLSNNLYADLVAYYSFDADDSSTAYDLTNNDNDGTYQGDATTDVSLYGNGLDLSSSSDYIQTSSQTLQDVTDNDFTMLLWVKIEDNSSYNLFINNRGSGSTSGLLWRQDFNDKVLVFLKNASGINCGGAGTSILPFNEWFQIGLWYNQTHLYQYINGAVDTVDICTNQGDTSGNQAMRIGQDTGGVGGFVGSMDEVMIFSRALNSTEISDIYNNQSKRFKVNGTIGYAPIGLNETSNIVNVSLDSSQELYGTDIDARVAYWDVDKGYNTSQGGLNDYLVAYYPLDSSANDYLGINNGSLQADANVSQLGIYNNSLSLDGTGDFVNVTDIDLSDAFSLETWVYLNSLPTTNNNYPLISKGTTNAPYVLDVLNDASNRKYFRLFGYEGATPKGITGYTTSYLEAGKWYHVIASFDGVNDWRIYVDGILTTQETEAGNPTDSNENTYLGYRSSYLDGRMDDVRIWNKSLTETEIRYLYNNGFANWSYSDYGNLNSNIEIPLSTTVKPELRLLDSTTESWYTPYVTGNLTVTTNYFEPEIAFIAITSNGTQAEAVQTIYVNLSLNYTTQANVYLDWANGTNYDTQVLTSPNLNYTWTSVPYGDYLLYANVTVDESISTSVNAITLSPDITDPFINITSPANNTDTQVPIIPIEVNVSDANPHNVTVYLFYANGTFVESNSTTLSTNPETVVLQVTAPTSGDHYLFYADSYDDYGNYNSTANYTIGVDYEFNTLDILLPLWENLYESTYVPLSYFAYDPSGVAQVWYNVLYSSNGTNSTYISNTTISGNTTVAITDIGSYYLNLWANDTVGNVGNDLTFFDVTNVSAGPEGPTGPTGPTGPQGPQGEPGVNGTSVDLLSQLCKYKKLGYYNEELPFLKEVNCV